MLSGVKAVPAQRYIFEIFPVKLNSKVNMRVPRLLFNKTFWAYVLFAITLTLISCLAICNLNKVTVSVRGAYLEVRTDNVEVRECLKYMGVYKLAKQAGVTITDDSNLINNEGKYFVSSHKLKQKISDDVEINLTYVEVKGQDVFQTLPYKTIKKRTTTLSPGEKRVIQKGQFGRKKISYRITHKDGKLTEQELVNSVILVKPVNQIIEVGEPFVNISRSKKGSNVKKGTFIFQSTAYTHTGYRTAVGIKPKKGIIAVDPRVIPLGTKVYVEGYGYAVAADTGGAIKGRIIDVFFETRAEALRWGRKKVKVTILG